MHSFIQVVAQYKDPNEESASANNASNEPAINPYCSKLNVLRKVQSSNSTDTEDTAQTARFLLGMDLKAIGLQVDLPKWTLGTSLARPNQIITAQNKGVGLKRKVRWFINEVEFEGDETKDTAKLKCTLPECYNDQEVKNEFN